MEEKVKVTWKTADFDDDGMFTTEDVEQICDSYYYAQLLVEELKEEGCNIAIKIW